MTMPPGAVKLRALVVEDEAIIAMLMEDMLAELGYEVVATAGRLDRAEELARQSAIDLAVVDVNLSGQESYPVAAILAERKIPFLFVSGYGAGALAQRWAGVPVVSKPLQTEQLAEGIAQALQSRSA